MAVAASARNLKLGFTVASNKSFVAGSFEVIMTPQQIQEALATFIHPSYPDMKIRVEAWADDPSRLAIYFLETKFALLYPQQRWHYLHHLIPAEFQDRYLSSSVWFELAPGESPGDLVYSDEELVADITEPIMAVLNKTSFFATLDEAFTRPENPARRSSKHGQTTSKSCRSIHHYQR